VHGGRVTPLNKNTGGDGKCVVYWMQSSLRVIENPALELAVREANARHMPLLVLYVVDKSIPSGTQRSFTFMLESLASVARGLDTVGARLCLRQGNAVNEAVSVCRETNAALLITDESHLKEGRRRRESVARQIKVPLYQVDANMVVPVRQLPGEQYAAYTIRPRLWKLISDNLGQTASVAIKSGRSIEIVSEEHLLDIKSTINRLGLPEPGPSDIYKGGEARAQVAMQNFIDHKLEGYTEDRNRPDRDGTSNLSPYLRFGCLSPARLLREVFNSGKSAEEINAFNDEAFVQRELAENFTFYNKNYRSLAGLPAWAYQTLADHRGDRREHVFSLEELEAGVTGDELWDASQHQLLRTGKMTGYMRMYWGKRVIEWMLTPEEALRALLYMNDCYEIDGRSPNGYAGVPWCFGKHDRAFAERPIYGKVRYMSPQAQRKKFDVQAYIKKWVMQDRR